MSFASVVDAWIDELTTSVDELVGAKTHRYASWSVEALQSQVNERHLAIWPQAETETVAGYIAGSPPADLAIQTFIITIWEDASVDSSRLIDDENANRDWLGLTEAVRDQLYNLNNRNLGDPQIMDTRYQGTHFEMAGSNRVAVIRFQVRVPHSFTTG